MHIIEAYIRLFFRRMKRKEISTHACTCTCACMCPPQLNRITQGCLTVHYMCECVCSNYSATPSTASVCLPVHVSPCVSPFQYEFVLKGQNKIAHPHKHTHHGTHVICVISWKASGGTDVIPFDERSSSPPSVGQEPVRTRGAPA
jgi:hypothetical protein